MTLQQMALQQTMLCLPPKIKSNVGHSRARWKDKYPWLRCKAVDGAENIFLLTMREVRQEEWIYQRIKKYEKLISN